MPQDNRIPEGVVPPPVKPPVPGSVLSEVSPISDVAWGPNEQTLSRMSQQFGDIEYRVELGPELASSPVNIFGYESIREKTGGDVSQLIKHVMSNVETGEVRGEDPERPIFGKTTRGRRNVASGIIRVNTTDRIDRFGERAIEEGNYDLLRKAQYMGGGDEVLAHEFGHEALRTLFAQGKADELTRIYGEDVITVMDFLRYADMQGDVNPPSAWSKFAHQEDKTMYEREVKSARERLNHPRVAMAILTQGHDQFDGTISLTPYEQKVANLVVKLNKEAAKQLTEKGISTEYPTPLSSNSLAAIDKYMEGRPEPVPEPREQEPVPEPRRMQEPEPTPAQWEARPDIHRFENPEEDGGYIHLDKPDILIFNNPDAGEFIYLNVNTGQDVTDELTGVKRAAGGFIDRPLYDRNPYG